MKAMLRLPEKIRVFATALLASGALAVLGCAADWAGSVGAVFGKDNHDGRIFVREAPKDMAAARAGLRVDDELLSVNGKLVTGMSSEDVHAALSGKVGTKVVLRVLREGQPLDVVVERGPRRSTP